VFSRLFKRKGQHPDNLLSLIQVASDLFEQGQLPEALSLLNEILKRSPNNDIALTLRGVVRGRMGDTASALADLSQAGELTPYNEVALFNCAVAHLRAGNGSEGLALLSRVLQLKPDDERASALREEIALDLGLEELDRVARVMEQFAYAQCSPGLGWKVELREMYRFQPNRPPETYNAALLDLCQIPQAFIQVTVTPTEYAVKINVEKRLPGIDRMCLSEVASDMIPAQVDVLLDLLNSFVDRGIIVKVGRQLRYEGT
jgi:tetratricopeptide (TPR) repeat protein